MSLKAGTTGRAHALLGERAPREAKVSEWSHPLVVKRRFCAPSNMALRTAVEVDIVTSSTSGLL